MSGLIVREFNGQGIEQRPKDGYMDATAMCRATGKKWSHYWSNKTTQEFVGELARSAGIPADLLVESNTGGVNESRGTLVHPKLAMHLAQWCSPRFAVVVSGWVFDILTTGKAEVVKPDADPILAMLDVVRVNRLKQIELEKKVTVVEREVVKVGARADRALRTARAARRTLKHQTGKYSVLGYCHLINRRCSAGEALRCGKHLAAKMKEQGETPETIADERWGRVNIYPEELLADYFGGMPSNN